VAQQVETAQLLPEDVRDALTVGLVCYARSVAGVQWDRKQAGTLGEDLNPWAVEMFRTFRTIAPATPLPAVGGRPMTGRPLRGPRDRPSRRGGSGLGHVTPAG
jgi:hypothetical protein